MCSSALSYFLFNLFVFYVCSFFFFFHWYDIIKCTSVCYFILLFLNLILFTKQFCGMLVCSFVKVKCIFSILCMPKNAYINDWESRWMRKTLKIWASIHFRLPHRHKNFSIDVNGNRVKLPVYVGHLAHTNFVMLEY